MSNTIKPGKPWLDNSGKRIQAHGGYLHYEDGLFYWYGENKEFTIGKGRIWTTGIKYYTSSDLCNWTYGGYLIEPSDDSKSVLHPSRRMDRPHIVKCEKTGQYVCWLKYCDKNEFSILVADRFTGPYTLIREAYQPYGKKCGDFDILVEDGKAYLFVETDHLDLIVCVLDDTFTTVEGECVKLYEGIRPPFTREGVTVFKRDGLYFLLTSGMMGYVPNPSEVAASSSVWGPYHILGDPHVDEPGVSSYNSQISCIFKHPEKDLYISLADRWVPEFVVDATVHDKLERAIASNYSKQYKASIKEKIWMMRTPLMGSANTSISDYVMLPLTFENGMPTIHWLDEWAIE